jgi:hypothetical protein
MSPCKMNVAILSLAEKYLLETVLICYSIRKFDVEQHVYKFKD